MAYTIQDFRRDFPDDTACLRYLFNKRWPRPVCPECSHEKCFYLVAGRRAFSCSWCGHQLYPTAGTIFHKSPTPLTMWFHAIFLMTHSRNGVAAMEIQRHLGVTYKCAWRIANQIRKLMRPGDGPLGGVVEADETYVGGKRRGGKRGRGAEGKTPVFGVVERGGGVKTQAVDDVKATTLLPILQEATLPGSMISTDDSASYNKVEGMGFIHERVRHSAGEYARGNVHTNTIEGYWSQFKRSLAGTYHSVSRKYLQSYLDEFSFRYARRFDPASLPTALLAKAGRPC